MAKTRVIGLDIGTTAVRAAQLEFGAGGPAGKGQASLVRYGEVPLPIGAVRDGEVTDQATVTQAIKQLWATHKFDSKGRRDRRRQPARRRPRPRRCRTCRSPSSGRRCRSRCRSCCRWRPTRRCSTSTRRGSPTAEQGRMVRGLLVAAVRDTVSANVMAVESAGLRATMVDLNAFALLRGHDPRRSRAADGRARRHRRARHRRHHRRQRRAAVRRGRCPAAARTPPTRSPGR